MTKRKWLGVLGGLMLIGWWSQAIPPAQGQLKTTVQVQSNQFSTQAFQPNLRMGEPAREWTKMPAGTWMPTIQHAATPIIVTPSPILVQGETRTGAATRTPAPVTTPTSRELGQPSPTKTAVVRPGVVAAAPTRLSGRLIPPTLALTRTSTATATVTRTATAGWLPATPSATMENPGFSSTRTLNGSR